MKRFLFWLSVFALTFAILAIVLSKFLDVYEIIAANRIDGIPVVYFWIVIDLACASIFSFIIAFSPNIRRKAKTPL